MSVRQNSFVLVCASMVNFQDDRAKIPLLVSQIDSFEYVVTANEHESLVLERNLTSSTRLISMQTLKTIKAIRSSPLPKGMFFLQSSTRANPINQQRAILALTQIVALHAI